MQAQQVEHVFLQVLGHLLQVVVSLPAELIVVQQSFEEGLVHLGVRALVVVVKPHLLLVRVTGSLTHCDQGRKCLVQGPEHLFAVVDDPCVGQIEALTQKHDSDFELKHLEFHRVLVQDCLGQIGLRGLTSLREQFAVHDFV